MFRKLIGACVGLAMMGMAGTANAVPLTLGYQVQNLGGGLFGYDFTLTLDNNDGNWLAGQEWDWIIFGDVESTNDPDGLLTSWGFTVLGPGLGGTSTTGFHNGPTIRFGASVVLPGWEPTALGQSLFWSGTSTALLGQGDLLWSTLVLGDGAVAANFEVANLEAPEPSTLALFATGLALLAFMGWRRRGVVQVKAA